MFDLYVDNISLREIQVKRNEQILLFKNEEKDEMVALNISNTELLNIFQKVKRRCEILNLMPITNQADQQGGGACK